MTRFIRTCGMMRPHAAATQPSDERYFSGIFPKNLSTKCGRLEELIVLVLHLTRPDNGLYGIRLVV